MKMLFQVVEMLAVGVFLVSTAIIGLWIHGGFQGEQWTWFILKSFVTLAASSIVVAAAVFCRWKYYWPRPVSWYNLGFGAASLVGLFSSTRSLLYVFGETNSPLMMKIVLPAGVAAFTGLCIIAAIMWYRDRSSQRPIWERS